MTWKKWALGACAALVLLMLSGMTALADTRVNLDELTKKRLAETEAINQACLKCHNQKPETAGRVPGQAPYVDPDHYRQSVHATIACTQCHEDVQPGNKPSVIVGGRELAKKVDKSCQKCHADIAKVYETSSHGKLFQEGKETALCSDCHGSHNIRKTSDPESLVYPLNSVQTCVKCHGYKYEETYEESFHGRAVHLGSLTAATCVSCHGSHGILGPEDPASSVNKANVPETCAQCHLKARPNFSNGTEHAELKPEGPGATTYWTLKFFTWLTIVVVTLLLIHVEMELWRRYQNINKHKG